MYIIQKPQLIGIMLEILTEKPDKATTLLKTSAIIFKSLTLAITCRHFTGVFNILPKILGREENLLACLQREPGLSQLKIGWSLPC